MMASYYSILKFVNNDVSQESISLGLFVISGPKLFFKLSEKKVNFAHKLNPESKKLMGFALKNLIKHFNFGANKNDLFLPSQADHKEYLNRLSNYNNGILQFSKPAFIKKDFDQKIFQCYFDELIGSELDKASELHQAQLSEFNLKLESKLYSPLRSQIDVDYMLKQSSLPSLFFDFHFDGLGVNGAMYGVKAIDFNSKKVNALRAEIAEYESVIDRLKKFASQNNINGQHQYYLLADPYLGSSPSNFDLYSILESEEMPSFKLANTSDIKGIVKEIQQNKAQKFSDMLKLQKGLKMKN